jgi:hypothetical protein
MGIAPRILRPAILATAVGVAWTAPIEVRAAVALCERSLSGDVAEDKSELLAKKRALESWVAHAGRLGEQFTRWGIARNRQLDCTRTDAGLFRCKAVGLPCAIRQVPPADFVPLRRGVSG